MNESDAQQRREPLDDPDTLRCPWDRDYARVIHSAASRRLQAKTQVLGMGDSDFYRTRLTHSLEVAQIGMQISKRLKMTAVSDDRADLAELLPEPMLVAAICMAHDIGHPPFGHGGEVALNRAMNGFDSVFEGNGQTLRIVTKLEKYSKSDGMNLTRRAILGLIKYPAPYSKLAKLRKTESSGLVSEKRDPGRPPKFVALDRLLIASDHKPPKCVHDEEYNDVISSFVTTPLNSWNDITNSLTDPQKVNEYPKPTRMSVDASVMDIADDIAYGVHDLEDAIALKLIDRSQFEQWLRTEAEESSCINHEDLCPAFFALFDNSLSQFCEQLFSANPIVKKKVIGSLVGFFVRNVVLKPVSPKLGDSLFNFRAEFREARTADMLANLKGVVVANVIESTNVQRMEFKGQTIVTDLFNAFMTDPKRLLEKHVWQKISGSDEQVRARTVCDHIAGMTDEYAANRHLQLFSPTSGSIFDKL